jgi:hypothetical protein
MKFLKAIFTAPVRAVKQTSRYAKIPGRALAIRRLIRAAKKNPRLYHDPEWWALMMRANTRLLDVLPVSKEMRQMTMLKAVLANYKTTLAGIAALSAAAAKVAADPSSAFTPETIAVVIAGIGLILGKDANVTGGSVRQ